MRRIEVERRADGHDAGRIDRGVAVIVVPFYVVHVDRLGDPRHLVKIAQIVRQARVVLDAPQITLEVAEIDGVETHKRCEQPPVGLGRRVTDEVALLAQAALQIVQSCEQGVEGVFVKFLAAAKAAFVDAVVERVVNALVERVDLGALVRGVEIERCVTKGVERIVEHANYLGRFVVDEGAGLFVPQHRHRHAA